MQVEIFLNANTRDSFVHGYQSHHTLVLAASYEVACPGEQTKATDDQSLLEDAFERFNIGEDAIAQQYRAKRHRSLSKGDVVVIQDGDERRAYAVASFGWTKLDGKLHVGKYRCSKCRQEFESDADRYEHYENSGHDMASLYY